MLRLRLLIALALVAVFGTLTYGQLIRAKQIKGDGNATHVLKSKASPDSVAEWGDVPGGGTPDSARAARDAWRLMGSATTWWLYDSLWAWTRIRDSLALKASTTDTTKPAARAGVADTARGKGTLSAISFIVGNDSTIVLWPYSTHPCSLYYSKVGGVWALCINPYGTTGSNGYINFGKAKDGVNSINENGTWNVGYQIQCPSFSDNSYYSVGQDGAGCYGLLTYNQNQTFEITTDSVGAKRWVFMNGNRDTVLTVDTRGKTRFKCRSDTVWVAYSKGKVYIGSFDTLGRLDLKKLLADSVGIGTKTPTVPLDVKVPAEAGITVNEAAHVYEGTNPRWRAYNYGAQTWNLGTTGGGELGLMALTVTGSPNRPLLYFQSGVGSTYQFDQYYDTDTTWLMGYLALDPSGFKLTRGGRVLLTNKNVNPADSVEIMNSHIRGDSIFSKWDSISSRHAAVRTVMWGGYTGTGWDSTWHRWGRRDSVDSLWAGYANFAGMLLLPYFSGACPVLTENGQVAICASGLYFHNASGTHTFFRTDTSQLIDGTVHGTKLQGAATTDTLLQGYYSTNPDYKLFFSLANGFTHSESLHAGFIYADTTNKSGGGKGTGVIAGDSVLGNAFQVINTYFDTVAANPALVDDFCFPCPDSTIVDSLCMMARTPPHTIMGSGSDSIKYIWPTDSLIITWVEDLTVVTWSGHKGIAKGKWVKVYALNGDADSHFRDLNLHLFYYAKPHGPGGAAWKGLAWMTPGNFLKGLGLLTLLAMGAPKARKLGEMALRKIRGGSYG